MPRLAGVFVAAMLLEALLCHAVEGQYRDSTFQTRGGYSPLTQRAAPAGEGITIDPDHALWGSYIHWVVLAKCFPVVTRERLATGGGQSVLTISHGIRSG